MVTRAAEIILTEGHLPKNPFDLFADWYKKAEKTEPNDPNAMALATTTPEGYPSVRMVLLKQFDAGGFVFYTNLDSRKGKEIRSNPHAALCFHWKSLQCQVRVEGSFVPVSAEEADEYYNSRPRGSRIGAWASIQSSKLDRRETLEKRVQDFENKFADKEISRPANWSGFRLVPKRIEFWAAGESRLHDRFVYARIGSDDWSIERLYP